MDYKEVIGQLQSLKENSESFFEKDEPNSVWADDIKALDEAMDIIYDYDQAVEQARRLTERYETVKDAIDRGMGNWQCPNCQKFISFGNEHCHWCGQRLGWKPKTRPRQGGRKCRKR